MLGVLTVAHVGRIMEMLLAMRNLLFCWTELQEEEPDEQKGTGEASTSEPKADSKPVVDPLPTVET